MRIIAIVAVLVFLAALFAACDNNASGPVESSPPGETPSLDKGSWAWLNWRKANEELEQRYVESMANKDVDAFMSCVWNSPEVIFVLDYGMVVRGWDNIYAGVKGMMEAHETLKLEVIEIDRFRRGLYVFAVGTSKWTQVPKGGGPTREFTERWTDVRTVVDGKWVVVMNHITIL